MKNTKPTVDTNILVYAHNADSPFFPSALELIEQLIEQGGFTVTSLILFEFYAVITDGRKIEKPLAPKDALAIIRDLVDSQRIGILESFNAKEFGEWLRTYGDSITRYQIYDANIAFSMQQEGLSKIYTLNTKDFKKFDFIDPVNPFEPSPLSFSLQAPCALPSVPCVMPHAPSSKLQVSCSIPYGRQSIDEKDVAAVCSVLRSDWLTTGPKVAEFEQAIADYVGAKYAVAVSSGTAALHAAMYAIGIGPGDEVIVPPMTFAATANCVVFQGGIPVFADVDPGTLLLDPAKMEEKITKKTKAIIGVDYAGQPCDWDRLREIADKHGLRLVADGCHALGAEYKGRKVGSLADMTIFSFHPVKHITTGEGGMITTDDTELAERMRLFRNHGITRDPKCFSSPPSDFRPLTSDFSWFYEMKELGYNYRITDFQCALGISQLEKLPVFLKKRRELAARYDEGFSAMPEISPLSVASHISHAYHLYVIRIEKRDRAKVFKSLREQGVGVNVHYIPVYRHPYYKEKLGIVPGLCPVAEKAYQKIISLPMFPELTNEDIKTIVGSVERAISQ